MAGAAEFIEIFTECCLVKQLSTLVHARLEQSRENHQVFRREEPLLGLASKRLSSGNETQTMALSEFLEMLGTNAREICNFRTGEDFWARLGGDHGSSSCTLRSPLRVQDSEYESWALCMGVTKARSVWARSCRLAR